MFLIIAVILISIAGILYLLFFNGKVKPSETPNSRSIHPTCLSEESTNNIIDDEVNIVFDEPTETQNIEISLGQSTFLENSIPQEKKESELIFSENTKSALTTNSKINPFNF